MQYYEDKKWERVYINAAKRTITELWETLYKVTAPSTQESENEDDDLLSHVFKKRRTERKDELTAYLKEPIVPSKTDVLLWWKVIFYISRSLII